MKSLCHDGGHSLSEPLHLFPQGSQTLSPIEEIEHCHRSPRVCLWEGVMLQPGWTIKTPLHAAPPPQRAPTCLLCPPRTRDLSSPNFPHASTSSARNWAGPGSSSPFSLPSLCSRHQRPQPGRPRPDLIDVFQQVAEAVRTIKEPVHHDDRLVGSPMGRGGGGRQQQEWQQEQELRRREPPPREPQHAPA